MNVSSDWFTESDDYFKSISLPSLAQLRGNVIVCKLIDRTIGCLTPVKFTHFCMVQQKGLNDIRIFCYSVESQHPVPMTGHDMALHRELVANCFKDLTILSASTSN